MMNMIAHLTAEAGRSPLVPLLYDIVWSAIIFVIILFVMVKYALPKYNEIVDTRASQIKEGLELRDRAQADQQKAAAAAQAELEEARKQAARIRDEANLQGEDIIARAKAKAAEESERILENANRQLLAQRQAAEISLRSEVGLISVELAEKIIGEQLANRELSDRVVDNFLSQLESLAK